MVYSQSPPYGFRTADVRVGMLQSSTITKPLEEHRKSY